MVFLGSYNYVNLKTKQKLIYVEVFLRYTNMPASFENWRGGGEEFGILL